MGRSTIDGLHHLAQQLNVKLLVGGIGGTGEVFAVVFVVVLVVVRGLEEKGMSHGAFEGREGECALLPLLLLGSGEVFGVFGVHGCGPWHRGCAPWSRCSCA